MATITQPKENPGYKNLIRQFGDSPEAHAAGALLEICRQLHEINQNLVRINGRLNAIASRPPFPAQLIPGDPR